MPLVHRKDPVPSRESDTLFRDIDLANQKGVVAYRHNAFCFREVVSPYRVIEVS